MCGRTFYPPEENFFNTTVNVFFLCACFLGIVNNTFVLFILYKFQRTSHLVFLKSLAVTDLCLNISFFFLPILSFSNFTIPENFGGDVLCRTYLSSFLVNFLGVASALHVVILAVEFYGSSFATNWYAIFFGSKFRVRLVVAITWFISIYTAIITPFITERENQECCVTTGLHSLRVAFVTQDVIFVFLVPFFIMVYCYISIVVHLREAISFYNTKKDHDPQASVDLALARKFQRTLAVRISCLFLLYIIVWLPLHIIRICHLLKIFGLHDDKKYFKYHFIATDILPMLTATLNPIIYGWTWLDFRTRAVRKLKKIFMCFNSAQPAAADNNLNVNEIPMDVSRVMSENNDHMSQPESDTRGENRKEPTDKLKSTELFRKTAIFSLQINEPYFSSC